MSKDWHAGRDGREACLLGESPEIRRARLLVERAAQVDSTVLILGESGVGKEVTARAIHALSERANEPLVAVNCGAIPSELLASELFGHERGAFTGAVSRHKGCFERAGAGTLLLDEIGEMSPEMQVKLLRVLEERRVERLGAESEPISVSARIIAATNQDLTAGVADGHFRADLFYRLNVVSIVVPPLRSHPGDIDALIASACVRLSGRGLIPPRISEPARALMRRYHWPGNVRQLFNVIERLSVLYPGELVGAEHLPQDICQPQVPEERDESLRPDIQALPVDWGEGFDLKTYLEQTEAELIEWAMSAADGVVAQAARLLGIRRTTLVEKLKRRNGVSGRSAHGRYDPGKVQQLI